MEDWASTLSKGKTKSNKRNDEYFVKVAIEGIILVVFVICWLLKVGKIDVVSLFVFLLLRD
jgi:hypothetical protein